MSVHGNFQGPTTRIAIGLRVSAAMAGR